MQGDNQFYGFEIEDVPQGVDLGETDPPEGDGPAVDWEELGKAAEGQAGKNSGKFAALGVALSAVFSPAIAKALVSVISSIADALGIRGATEHLGYDEAFPSAHTLGYTNADKILAKSPTGNQLDFATIFSQRAVAAIWDSPMWNQTQAQISNKTIYTNGIRTHAWTATDAREKLRITLENIFLWTMTAAPTDRPSDAVQPTIDILNEVTAATMKDLDGSGSPGGLNLGGINLSSFSMSGFGILIIGGIVYLLWRVFNGK